jgi:hypothetical protein
MAIRAEVELSGRAILPPQSRPGRPFGDRNCEPGKAAGASARRRRARQEKGGLRSHARIEGRRCETPLRGVEQTTERMSTTADAIGFLYTKRQASHARNRMIKTASATSIEVEARDRGFLAVSKAGEGC